MGAYQLKREQDALTDQLASKDKKISEQSQLVMMQQNHIQRLKTIAIKDKQSADHPPSFEKVDQLRSREFKQLPDKPTISPHSTKIVTDQNQTEFLTAEGNRVPSDKRQTLKLDFSAPAIYKLEQLEQFSKQNPLEQVSRRIQAIQRPTAIAPTLPAQNPAKPKGLFSKPDPPKAAGMHQELIKPK